MKTVASSQLSVVSEERGLTPAMERWRERLAAGYTIRPRLRMGERGYVVWGPALFNPDGGFVQNVRRDVMRKLMRLGILGEDGRAAAQDKDASNADIGTDDAALDIAPAGGIG